MAIVKLYVLTGIFVFINSINSQQFLHFNAFPSTGNLKWLLQYNFTGLNNSTNDLCNEFENSTLCESKVKKLKVHFNQTKSESDKVYMEQVLKRSNEGFWYEDIPLPAIAVATSDSLPDGACKRQLTRYIQELRNGTTWATQMFDASAKQPYGIIDGQTRHLGSFDQCYRINVEVPGKKGGSAENVKGRYCLVDYKYKQRHVFPDFKGDLDIDFDPNDSVWEAVKEKGDFRRIRRYLLQMALCVPAACSAKDITKSLQSVYDDFGAKTNLIVKVSIDYKNCQAYHEEPEFTTGSYVYCGILFAIFTLVVIASLYDSTLETEEDQESASRLAQILLCFSAKRNYRTITEVSYRHRGLDTIHLLRFFMMILVIFGHRTMQYYLNTTVNKRYLELTFNIPSFIMVHNGTIIVDGFLAFGGLLTCYGLLEQFDKSKKLNFVGITLIRFLRLTPAYALLIFFHAYLFQHIGSGPQWQSKIVSESEHCAATWWANLFYLNNYFTMDRMCVFQSWYVSVDFHCYLVATFLIWAFWKYPRYIGYSLFGIATFISIVIPFCVTYWNRIQPMFIPFPYLNGLAMDPYFNNYYVKSHLRMSSYFVGVIAGAILYDYEKKASWRISKRWSQLLFILLVVILSIYSQSLGFRYLNPNANRSTLEVALYASLHRATFAVSFCSIILLIVIGDGLDFHYNFLTPRWAQPLGRLTYSAFITHNLLQAYHIGTARTAKTFSLHNGFYELIPDLFYAFSLAFLIALGVEGPFRKLEKHFLTKRSRKAPKSLNNESSKTQPMEIKKID